MPDVIPDLDRTKIANPNQGIFDLYSNICQMKDGCAEPAGKGILHTLLPEFEARSAGLGEEMVLSLEAGIPGTRYAGFGSEILEAFTRLMGEEGSLAELAIEAPHYLKSGGYEKLVSETFTPRNGIIKFIESSPSVTPYYYFHAAYTGWADEKRQGLASFWMNGLTGAAPVNMGETLERESLWLPVDSHQNVGELDSEELKKVFEAVASQMVDRELNPWRRSLERRLKRDQGRVTGYFRDMASEIRTRARKKGLEGELLQREMDRAKATEKEAERKIEDLKERHSIKIEAQLLSCLRVLVPTVHLRCELRRKQIKREVTAVYNPFSRQLEPLRCEKSHVAVTIFDLGDAGAEILAPECARKSVRPVLRNDFF